MGINELLKILKPIIIEKSLSDFKGKTAAVDMMAWIYRGAYASAVDIGQGKKSDLYLNFPLKMVAMLKSFGIECIAVFDGKSLKAKQAVEELRSENKEKNLEQAKKLQLEGKDEESKKIFRRALKIKSRMVNTLIEILKNLGVRVIVAPYEADSQISFLCQIGKADFAISEDSDLIPFGVGKIVYKLDANGDCSYLDMESFLKSPVDLLHDLYYDPAVRSLRKIFSSPRRMVEFCVMLGCDYLPSIKGFGYKTAISMFESYDKLDMIIHKMKFVNKLKKNFPYGYEQEVKKCVALFFLQTIYNPIENKLQPLNSEFKIDDFGLEEDLEKYLGSLILDNYSHFCNGNLDIKTMKKEKKTENSDSISKYVNKYQWLFNIKSRDNQSNIDQITQNHQSKFVNNFGDEDSENQLEEICSKHFDDEEELNKNEATKENENYSQIYLNNSGDVNFNHENNILSSSSSAKKHYKSIQNNIYSKHDGEIKNILKMCETLSKEINVPKKDACFNMSFSPYKRVTNFAEEDEKPIKDLFDIIENEKKGMTEIIEAEDSQLLENSISNKSVFNPHSASKDILSHTAPTKTSFSPNFNRIISPFKPNSGVKSNLTTGKSPDSSSKLNPNFYFKRKFHELEPKSLNFGEGKDKSKKEMDIKAFFTKRFNDGNNFNK